MSDWPKYWITCIWTANGHELAAHERGFTSAQQARNRAEKLFTREAGGEPWHGQQVTGLHIDVLAQNDKWAQPVIISTYREDNDETT